jgi:glycosyltransferase involved in cell wall biosynthesis
MNITVAICCYNSAKVLGKTMQTLRESTPVDLPVLVIDDGSTDATCTIAEIYSARVVRHDTNKGYGWARQSALENCETEIIAFIDDSCLLSSDWYGYLLELWTKADSNTHAIAGKMDIFEPKTFFQKFMVRHNPFLPLPLTFSRNNSIPKKLKPYLIGKQDLSAGFISGFSNGNASFRRSSLNEIGGYDICYRFGAEDEDVAARLQKRFGNTSIYYDPLLKVSHFSNDSVKGYFLRNYKYGRSAAFRKHLEGGIPLLSPIPLLFIFSALFLILEPLTILSILLPFAIPMLYLGRISRIKYGLDIYIILVFETLHLVGFLSGAIKFSQKARAKEASLL